MAFYPCQATGLREVFSLFIDYVTLPRFPCFVRHMFSIVLIIIMQSLLQAGEYQLCRLVGFKFYFLYTSNREIS